MLGNLNFIYDERPILKDDPKKKDFKSTSSSNNIANPSRYDQLFGDGKRKQQKLEQISEALRLEEMLKEIQQEEAREGINGVSRRLTAQRKPGQFYEINKQWAANVKEKKQQQRMEAYQQQISAQQQMQTQMAFNNQEFNSTKAGYNERMQKRIDNNEIIEEDLFILQNYSGPISGWQNRFEHYLNQKMKAADPTANVSENNTFHPKLNETSVRMTAHRDKTPVEQRLLKYGEERKIKQDILRQQAEMVNWESEEGTIKKPTINKNYLCGESDGTTVYDKLYDYAKMYGQKKEELIEETFTSRYTFKPDIKPIPKGLIERVNQKRKPLYQVPSANIATATTTGNKTSSRIIESDNAIGSSNVQKPEKKFNVADFEQFLERNYTQFEKKLERIESSSEQIQKRELEGCSFYPNTNKSKNYLGSKQQSGFDYTNTSNGIGQIQNTNSSNLSIYERTLQNQQKKKEQTLQKQNEEEELLAECTFKPNLKPNVLKERREQQKQIQQAKEAEAKRHKDKTNQTKAPSLQAGKTGTQNPQPKHKVQKTQIQDVSIPENEEHNEVNISGNLNLSNTANNPAYGEPIPSSSRNSRSKSRHGMSPSSKTTFKPKSLSSHKKEQDNGPKTNFIQSLLAGNASGINASFNLESLLNNSVSQWIGEHNVSPNKMTKKKIIDEFSLIESQLCTIVEEATKIETNKYVLNKNNSMNDDGKTETEERKNENSYGQIKVIEEQDEQQQQQ